MDPLVIRTSDRQSFKRCRRRWAFSSPLRMNLEPDSRPSYFWLGTGGHFALEDYHGYNRYGHPAEAFKAYVEACRKEKTGLPDDWHEQAELGVGLMDYYLTWLQHRDPLETLWVDGVPQVEVRAQIPLPSHHVQGPNGEPVAYDVTIDRVVRVEGELWILDYKFYKQFYPINLDLDDQMTSYMWAASVMYDEPVVGAIFEQHKKDLPEPPRILSSGKISTDKNQNTTHRLYREALEMQYGQVDRAPKANIDCLNHLALIEGEDRDKFIVREYTKRNYAQLEAAGDRILMEAQEMVNPDLPLYPNFTKDCSWDCQFSDICLMIERDDDWEPFLYDTTRNRTEQRDTWRDFLPTL